MAQRTVALCGGKYIGIESIYTVIDGQQINIPEKLKELRLKSRNNELFCPCGCGSNLILVAGDKNLREQHFRLKDGASNQDCHVITEGKVSVNSKIVLKCWLDEKIKASDIESRVPIQAVDDISRRYEFSFLSREKKIALSYSYERVNLSDEKLSVLESNSQGIHIIYFVDCMNGGSDGQYPEGLMKIQNKQGFCLLLSVDNTDYKLATVEAVFYAKDIDGFWQEVSIANGQLSEFSIDGLGNIILGDRMLLELKEDAEARFVQSLENEKSKRIEAEKRRVEIIKCIQREEEHRREELRKQREESEKVRKRRAEEAAKRQAEREEKQRVDEEERQAEKCRREEDFKRNMESNFSQQETQVWDATGNRWIKCELCGKIAMENEFGTYGGPGHINLGICKECFVKNTTVRKRIEERAVSVRSKREPDICPECGGKLCERSGPYGYFMGCSNYPACKYIRKM